MNPRAFEIVPFTNVDDLPEPTAGPYIVATKEGYFAHRTFHFGRILVPTNEAPLTPIAVPTLWHTIDPLLPASLIGQAFSFFKTIYETRKSEAMVDITWHPDNGYRLFVPPQRASGGGVTCTRTPEHYQGQIVGTIHSHCNFSAFHSGTDKHDADSHDGLHITIGDVMKDTPSIAIMISASKCQWNFQLNEVSDGPLALHPHPEWWERYVSDPVPTPATAWTNTWAKNSPNHGAITGPTKQNPTVVGSALSPSVLGWDDLDALLWRYQAAFTDQESAWIEDAAGILDQVRDSLAALGIHMETEFTVEPATPKHDDNDDPRLLTMTGF